MEILKEELKKIKERCAGLDVLEKRNDTDEFYELVLYNRQLDEWERLLSGVMGPAVKPPRARASREDERLTEEYGGIDKNQTLFKKEHEDSVLIAMLWPWDDHTYTTLKIAIVKKQM